LLQTGLWESHEMGRQIRWELRTGDFLEMEDLPATEVVFFDFYSPKAAPELWGLRSFKKVRACCAPNAVLVTYCASTSARAALLLAGFFVGAGRPTAAKAETTVASPERGALEEPLGHAWLEKLARSEKPFPQDWTQARDVGLAQLGQHPQFARK